MAGKFSALCFLQVEDEHRKLPFFGNAAIQLAQGACGAVAGIGKGLQAQKFLAVIHRLKGSLFHVDFPTNLKVRQAFLQLLPDILDDPGIGGDVLPLHQAVATGNSPHKFSILIAQGQGKTVYLFLYHKFRAFQFPLQILHKAVDFFLGENVLQRQHGHIVLHQHPGAAARLASHHLGRRVLGDKLGIGSLQSFQAQHQLVVFVISDFRIIFVIVAVVMVANLLPQAGKFCFDGFDICWYGFCHAATSSSNLINYALVMGAYFCIRPLTP